MSAALFFASVSRVAFGTFAKAAFVGANTVSWVLPESSSARPAFLTSASSVESCGVFAARPAIVGDACSRVGAALAAGTARARAASTTRMMRVIGVSFLCGMGYRAGCGSVVRVRAGSWVAR